MSWDSFPEDHMPEGRHHLELDTNPLETMSAIRRERLRREKEIKARFVTGDELHSLRQRVGTLRAELALARKKFLRRRAQELEGAILKAQQMDAEFIYSVALDRMEAAQQWGQVSQAAYYRRQALEARSALPQFNLEGLWVGKYGEQGYEMINVTYAGDMLIAYKVTGDKNVPKGQISFKADLSPRAIMAGDRGLEPIELGEDAARQWGTKFLERFGGEGQVAHQGYVNSQWIDGQLILVGRYFSFAWLPIGHQVFFGRPSAELTLKLLRQSRERVTPSDKIRAYLAKCMDETEHLMDEMEATHNQHEYCEQGRCFE